MARLSQVNRRLLLTGATAASVIAGRARAANRPRSGGKGDLACLHGQWTVAHRRRTAAGTWERLSGTCVVSPVLGGLGAVEDHSIAMAHGIARRASLRLFDPETARWSAWIMGRAELGVGPRLTGRSNRDGAILYGVEMAGGGAVNVRHTWTILDAGRARWEQATSSDGGATWATDYVMAFERHA